MALNKNAKKWVKALRSGKFKRTEGRLRIGDMFCCLGVACEIAKKDGVRLSVKKFVPVGGGECFAYGGQHNYLPSAVRRWLGLADQSGSFAGDEDSLAAHNDDGESFAAIARLIESQPAGLFQEVPRPKQQR